MNSLLIYEQIANGESFIVILMTGDNFVLNFNFENDHSVNGKDNNTVKITCEDR